METLAQPAAPPQPLLRRLPVETVGYYYAQPGPKAPPNAPTLLGLHGYAQTGADFLGIMQKLAPDNFVASAAQGFHQLWDYNTKQITFSWLTSFEKADNHRRNNQFLASVIEQLALEQLADPAKVFLLGFSQGSSVAYRFALSHPDRVRGVISVCSDLPPDVESNLARMRGIPVMIVYGLRDPIVPTEKPLHAVDALRAAGIEVEVLSFDRGHLIPSSIASKAQEWMRRRLNER